VASELERLGVVVGLKELRQWAKSKAVEAIGEVLGKVEGAAKRDVEELRNMLVQHFDEVAREAADEYRRTKSEKARWRAVGAVVAKKFFAENVDDPVWWTLLLLGDGIVKVREHDIGFAAKPVEAAEAVMYVFARVMGVPPEVQRVGKSAAVLSRDASRAAVEALFKQLEEVKIGDTPALQFFTAVAEWWLGVGTGGSRPPKLLSLRALRELAAGEEGRWVGAWLSYEAVVARVPEAVARWFEGVYRVSVEPPQRGAVGFYVYFERGGERFKLHTDLSYFHLYCESCGGAAKDVLTVAAKALGIKKPRWVGNALVLPAGVGWAVFLNLFERHSMSLRVEEGGQELLRVEVLEARADGKAKFRLWYYKWRETRPDRPYVDVEIEPHPRKDGVGFVGYVYANKRKGILREHLDEIAKLLKRSGVEGVSLRSDGKGLYFTGAFRDSMLGKLGVKPELPRGEPPAVEYLGGLKFSIGDEEVEFGDGLYAKLMFPSGEEAERFAASLKAIDVYAEVRGNTVRLDSDAFFGLLAATNAAPPGLTPLYRSNDLQVYASVEEGMTRFYFAVKHEGVWRVAEGLYNEKTRIVQLRHAEREVLEAVRGAVARALKELGLSADVGEPKEDRDEKGKVKAHYLLLYGPHVTPFLEHAAEHVDAKPAEVRLEGRRIVIRAGGVKKDVEFELLKRHKAVFLMAKDVEQTLTLYKSLKALGVRVEITPQGVRVGSEAMWALMATAAEKSTPNTLPAEVMPGVELLKVYNISGMRIYAFKVSEDGVHYYFAVKTGQEWSAAGGMYAKWYVMIAGDAARTVADAINAIYRERGVERRVEVKYYKNNVPYIRLTNVDLELLGLK